MNDYLDEVPIARPVQRYSMAAPTGYGTLGPHWRPPALPSPLTLPYLSRRTAILHLVIVAVFGIAAPFGLEIVAAVLLSGSTDATASAPSSAPAEALDALQLIVWKAIQALSAVVLLVIFLWVPGLRPESFGLRLRGMVLQLAMAAVTAIATYGYLILSSIVVLAVQMTIFHGMQEDLENRARFLESIPDLSTAQAVMLFACVAAHEEVLFRGLLLPYLRRVTGSWILAVVISSAIFGSLHLSQGIVATIQITGIGVVLAVAFIRTRSLLTVILAHFAFDFLQLQVLMPLLRRLMEASGAAAGG